MERTLKRVVRHAGDGLRAKMSAVWRCDRTRLSRLGSMRNRILRVSIASLRGLSAHQIGLQAAALTYYTVFSLVPLLVFVLWSVKALHAAALPTRQLPHDGHWLSSGNALLASAIHGVFENVGRTAALTGGIISLGVLLYAAIKMFAYAERALDTIASSTQRKPKLMRLLGFVALLVMGPLLTAVAGVLVAAARTEVGEKILGLLGPSPAVKLTAIAAASYLTVAVGVTIFYSAAARARIPFRSAAVGGLFAAALLAAVSWAFGEFQIGMSRANRLQFGAAAGPVLLLWLFACWYVVLLGAEIAVAHSLDRVLKHGVAAFHLDAVGKQEAAIAIVARAARAPSRATQVDDLARDMRLPPAIVRDLCLRLQARGLLEIAASGGFVLACDPEVTTVVDIADAILRDPDLHPARGVSPEARGAPLRSIITMMSEDQPEAAYPAPPRASAHAAANPATTLAELAQGIGGETLH